MKKIYNINNYKLLIECNIEAYDDIIEKRMLIFSPSDSTLYDGYIKIDDSQSKIEVRNIRYTIKGKIIKTDLYPIINNIISNLINDISNLYIHSNIISYKNNGILILGDFGSGKSTIALEAEKNGFEINSTDQTWIYKKNNQLYMKMGSRYLKYNNKDYIIDKNKATKNIFIKKIIILKGVCDYGKVSFEKIISNYILIKSISKFCTWSCDSIIFSNDFKLKINKNYIKQFWETLNVNSYYVRGDAKEIVKKLKEWII